VNKDSLLGESGHARGVLEEGMEGSRKAETKLSAVPAPRTFVILKNNMRSNEVKHNMELMLYKTRPSSALFLLMLSG
ncbi:hypothetical protein L9F63_015550, partial [Diploptera punctata]